MIISPSVTSSFHPSLRPCGPIACADADSHADASSDADAETDAESDAESSVCVPNVSAISVQSSDVSLYACGSDAVWERASDKDGPDAPLREISPSCGEGAVGLYASLSESCQDCPDEFKKRAIARMKKAT